MTGILPPDAFPSMTAPVIALALLAAILHASWNAFLRVGADRYWALMVMSFPSTIMGIVLFVVAPFPAAGAWPIILVSSVFQLGYSLALVAAYREGDLGQVYPIMRGSIPLLVTLGGLLFTGQHLGPVEIVGIVLLAIGVMSLALGGKGTTRASVGFALLAGAVIATYSTLDSIGVRAAGGNALGYTAGILVVYGVLLPIAYVISRRRFDFDPRTRGFGPAFLSGTIAMVSYVIIIYAFTKGPAGPITALRETSVVFATLIGWLFLKEKLTARRIAACVVVALGAILIGW
jgi:drug/metabolite transporter (DMT)-like permease